MDMFSLSFGSFLKREQVGGMKVFLIFSETCKVFPK